MKNNSLLAPLFKTIDKILFGIDEVNEMENPPESLEKENEEDKIVVRSVN